MLRCSGNTYTCQCIECMFRLKYNLWDVCMFSAVYAALPAAICTVSRPQNSSVYLPSAAGIAQLPGRRRFSVLLFPRHVQQS